MSFMKLSKLSLATGIAVCLITISLHGQGDQSFHYFGQSLPGLEAELFAPGIVSTDEYNHASISMHPSGTEIYWALEDESIGHRVIKMSEYTDGQWSE